MKIKIKSKEEIEKTLVGTIMGRGAYGADPEMFFDSRMLPFCGYVMDAVSSEVDPYAYKMHDDASKCDWYWHKSWCDEVADLGAQQEGKWEPLVKLDLSPEITKERKQITHEALKLFCKQMYKAELNLQKLGSVGFQVDWANVERRKALVDQMIEETK